MCKKYTYIKEIYMKKAIVINIMGGPGAGKSTLASMLFANLKMNGVSCEYVTEYAKDVVWEKRLNLLNDQLYILSKQYRRIKRVSSEVDVVITDSPLLLSLYYNSQIKDIEDRITEPVLRSLILELNNKFNNYYYFIERAHKYETKGRYQTEEESNIISAEIKNMLIDLNIDFKSLPSGKETVNKILKELKGIINDK